MWYSKHTNTENSQMLNQIFLNIKKVSYANQGCIYLNKNAVNIIAVILQRNIISLNKMFKYNILEKKYIFLWCKAEFC